MNLTQLANKFHSDKGTVTGGPPHKYTYLYDLIFYPLRTLDINVLEMGLAVGGPELGGPIDRHVISPSVEMWTEYFSSAVIFGFDISDFSHMKHPRFRFIRGDSGVSSDIERLCAAADYFHVIIDDASHASYHQQLAFKYLWNKLASGGLYIIEDLQWQSPVFENSLPRVPKTAAFLEALFVRNDYSDNILLNEDFCEQLKKDTFSFSAFHAFDGSASPIKQIVLRKR